MAGTKNPFSGGKRGKTPAPPAGASASRSGAVGHDGEDSSGPDAVGPESGGGAGGESSDSASSSEAVGRIRAKIDPERDLLCARLPLTDLGNAERWLIRWGQDFRFCPEIGWFGWDGRRWKLLSEEKDRIPARVMQSVFLTVRAIRNEAALVAATGCVPPVWLGDKQLDSFSLWAGARQAEGLSRYLRGDEDGARAEWLDGLDRADMLVDEAKRVVQSDKIAAWAKTSEGSGKLKSVADLAKSFESINIAPDAMDADRLAINVLNGTLRLVQRNVKRSAEDVAAGKSEWKTEWTIRKFPHDRADLLSKLAPVKYAPGATCPDYDSFLARVQPDEHMRRFIHQWGGYSLTGDIGEHKLAFFYGGGRNGKGTWVELVAALAGDYAGSVGVESLADTGGKRRGDQATPDLAELPGVRFLRVSEPEKGMAFNDGLVKQLTGGDPVKARFLNKGFFEFLPSFKITISGNNKPNIRDTSHGFWARMQLVPWAVTIPEDEIDRRLPAKLAEQASGVLNRLIEGLLDWRRNGLIVPEEVRMATREYRDQSDDLGRFLTDCCVVSDGDDSLKVGAAELYAVFRAWADQTGGGDWKIKGFKKAMEDRGFRQKASNGMKWLRVSLKPGVDVDSVKAGMLPGEPDVVGGDDFEPPEGW